MKTIKWLVSQLPPTVRTLFAVLLIAIASLASVVIYLDNQRDKSKDNCEALLNVLNDRYKRETDSLHNVILQMSAENKKEVIESLERIIADQKETINSQLNERRSQSNTRLRNSKSINSNEKLLNNK